MGNINSHLSRKRSATKTQKFDQRESDKEWEEKQLEFYLENGSLNIDLLPIYHFLKRHMLEGNFSSPIEDKLIEGGCKVLDVGCGPGTWLLDLSSRYENSRFFGVDIKPVYPQEIKPNNLEFIESNMLNGLSFRDNEFDFTHIESMSFILTPDQWDFVLSELIRVTKPGGYIEISGRRNAHDGGEGPVLRKITGALWSSLEKRNIDIKFEYNLDSKLQLYSNIDRVYRLEKGLIIGPNGGKIGLVCQDLALSYYSSEMTAKTLSAELGISEKEFKNMVKKDLVEELKQTSPKCVKVRFWTQKQGL